MSTCRAPIHGNQAAYRKGCRCPEARADCARYQNLRTLDRLAGRPRKIPIVGPRRRLQALVALGWTCRHISGRLGIDERTLWKLIHPSRQTHVLRVTADTIRQLYDDLCMQPGPSPRARNNARKYGWHPPLAWDDIDDPGEQPGQVAPIDGDYLDHAAILRRAEGDRTVSLTKAEAREVIEWLRRRGHSDTYITKVTGLKVERYATLRRDLPEAS